MGFLRAILVLVILAVTPVHVASAAGIPLPGPVLAQAALPDCCQDGSHRTPGCQMQTELREDAPLAAPDRPAHRLRAAFRAARLTGRMPNPALPPPRRV